MWHRAERIEADGRDAGFVREINEFRVSKPPTIDQYLRMEDATLIYQIQAWTGHEDEILSDLASRFLGRNRLCAIDDPVTASLSDQRGEWESELQRIVAASGRNPEYYLLRDDLKLTIYNPYIPEKEVRQQDPYNAIFVQSSHGEKPREISTVLERLSPVTGARKEWLRYYVPIECRDEVLRLATSRRW
jgi:hypothetical protein